MNNPFKSVALYLGALIMAAVLCGFSYGYGVETEREFLNTKHAAELAEIRADLGAEVAHAEKRERDKEQQFNSEMAAMAADYHAKDVHAKSEVDRLAASVRAGDVRLRDRFTCPASGGVQREAGAASAGSSGGDAAEGGGLHRDDAEFLVRFAGRADEVSRQLAACQGVVRADRGQ